MARVAVVGNLSRDVVDRGAPTAGGGSFFAAEAFRRLGAHGQIVTRFAERDHKLFEGALGGIDARVTLLPAATTTGFTMDYDGEERAMAVTAVGETWTPEDASAVEEDIGWVHVAPLLRSDFPAATLEAFARGRRLSLDGQGLVRRPSIGPLITDADYDPAVLSCVTALKLSEDEARVVGGGPFTAAVAAALGVPEVLLTLGSRGATVVADGIETFVPGRPVLGVQATGAGDTFMVAYASARETGHNPVAAAERACALVTEMLEERRSAAS